MPEYKTYWIDLWLANGLVELVVMAEGVKQVMNLLQDHMHFDGHAPVVFIRISPLPPKTLCLLA